MKKVQLRVSGKYCKVYQTINVNSMDDFKNEVIKLLKECGYYDSVKIENNIKKIGISEPDEFYREDVGKWISFLKFLKKDFNEINEIHHVAIFSEILK